jgi:hypothetical protein
VIGSSEFEVTERPRRRGRPSDFTRLLYQSDIPRTLAIASSPAAQQPGSSELNSKPRWHLPMLALRPSAPTPTTFDRCRTASHGAGAGILRLFEKVEVCLEEASAACAIRKSCAGRWTLSIELIRHASQNSRGLNRGVAFSSLGFKLQVRICSAVSTTKKRGEIPGTLCPHARPVGRLPAVVPEEKR